MPARRITSGTGSHSYYVGTSFAFLSRSMRGDAMKGAMKGMRRIKKEAVKVAPKKTGDLRKTARLTKPRTGSLSRGEQRMEVKFGSGAVNYAVYVHNWYRGGRAVLTYQKPTTRGTKPWFVKRAYEKAKREKWIEIEIRDAMATGLRKRRASQ